MNQDHINRDRLLTEVHSDMKHLVSWAKKHDQDDDHRFKEVRSDIEWGKRILWMALGGVALIEFLSKVIK